MFAALGSKVTVVDGRAAMLDFCDPEIIEALRYHLRDLGVIFRFGEIVTAVGNRPDGTITQLASGKQIAADAVFYSAGRVGATADLRLEQVGLEVDERGRIAVDSRYRTAVEHIYAVGDVIGFPSLASASAEQGRIASCDACGVEAHSMTDLLPFGVYSIPEISFVGRTEPELTADAIPYEVGISHYRELARGQILGETHGLVKLLVSSVDHTLLGVHAIGAAGDRGGSRRAGGHGPRRHRGLPRRHRVQLPDARRGLQGGRARREQQAARGVRPRVGLRRAVS